MGRQMIAWVVLLFAAEPEIRGRVLERGTRRPVSTDVRLESGGGVTETVSGADGRFAIEWVSSATLSIGLDVRLPSVPPGDLGDVLVEPSSLYETTVRGRVVKKEPARRAISQALIRSAPGTAGDTFAAVQNLPGVARNAYGGGQPILRGSAPGDSAAFLEGQRLGQLYHFGGLRSTVAPRFIDRLDFVPGNFGPEFGGLVGGVIDVKLRDPADDLFRGEVDLNLYDASLALEGPIAEGLSIGGSFRRSWIDAILPAVLPDDASLSFDTAPRYYDYLLLARYRASPTHRLRLIAFGSLDRLQILFDDPADDPVIRGALSTLVMGHSLVLESRSRPIADLTQTIALRASTSEITLNLGPDFSFDLDVFDVAVRGDWRVVFDEGLALRFGTDSRVRQVAIALTAPSPPKEGEPPLPASVGSVLGAITEATLFEPAVYAEAELRPDEGLTIRPSLRLDYFGAIHQLTFDPRLSVEVELTDQLTLRGAVGSHQQQPEYDESAASTGNPDLLAKRALQTSVGAEIELVDGLEIELVGFAKWLDRWVVRDPLTRYANAGSGRIFGLEALVRFERGDLSGWVAYTFQRSLRTDRPGASERPFDFDQPHNLNAALSWQIGAGWSIAGRFRLISGNPYSPVVGSIYDAASDVFVPLYGSERDRLPVFHQLDVRVEKVFVFDVWRFIAYLDVQNVYNQANVEGYRYNFDYSEVEPATGLPVLPILGMRGEW